MSENEVLSKDEVGALLTGVADGVVATNGGVKAKGEVTAFEYKSSSNVSSYCPASLVNIYTRTSRHLQSSLFELLRRDVVVELESIRRHRYDEYFATLEKPICIHTVTAKELPGTALFVIDAALIYDFVDNYFGGAGEPAMSSEDNDIEREITPSEIVMSRKLLDLMLKKLSESWTAVTEITFDYKGFETDPTMVTVAAASEAMLIVKLGINMTGSVNDCHIAMPLSMLEPVRAKLEASGQGGLSERERFQRMMRQSLRKVPVTLHGNLCEIPLTLRQLLSLSPGDILPVDLPSSIELQVDKTPVLFGRFGKSRGMDAVCIAGRAVPEQQDLHSNEALK